MKMKTDFEERTLRQPINPFPDGDPDLAPRNINAPGSTAAGKSDDDSNKVMCRICGPRIEGVIGVPNPDPAEPWPARNADGSEQNPFEVQMGALAVGEGIREASLTAFPSYQVYDPDPGAIIDCTNAGGPFTSDMTFNFMLSSPGVDFRTAIPITGIAYTAQETLEYTLNDAGIGMGNFTVSRRPVSAGDTRVDINPGDSVFIFTSEPTGNSTADLEIMTAADRSISSINVKDSNSRGRNYTDNSIFVVINDNLGGGERTGALIFTTRSTHWPDEDVSTCIVPEQGKEDVARQYCCFEDSLTGKDWAGGEGRCASLAQYNVARPEEWPQHCPDGFEYAPGDDGLFCKKCATGTSSFDPTLNPANCPGNGVGCQKCCEDPGVSCP
jgi:hypothetical protein